MRGLMFKNNKEKRRYFREKAARMAGKSVDLPVFRGNKDKRAWFRAQAAKAAPVKKTVARTPTAKDRL